MSELHMTTIAAMVLAACILLCIWRGPRDE